MNIRDWVAWLGERFCPFFGLSMLFLQIDPFTLILFKIGLDNFFYCCLDIGIPQCQWKISTHVWCSVLQNQIYFYWSIIIKVWGIKFETKNILGIELVHATHILACWVKSVRSSGMCDFLQWQNTTVHNCVRSKVVSFCW